MSTTSFLDILNKIRSDHIIFNGLLTTALSAIGKGIGFVIPIFVAWLFGVTRETDAFFFAYGVTFFLVNVFSMVAESVLVPFVAEAKDDLEGTSRFLGSILMVGLIVLIPLTILLMVLAWFVLPLITNFSTDTDVLIFTLLVVISPLILLVFWSSVFNGALNAHAAYWLPALSPGLRAIIVMICAYGLKDQLGIYGLVLGYVVAEVGRLGVSALWLVKHHIAGLNLSLSVDTRIKEFFKTSFFYIIGTASIGLNPVVDRTFASYAGLGGVTLLEYGRNLFYAVIGLSSGFFIVMLSDWSRRFYQENTDQVKQEVLGGAKIVMAIALVITIILWPLSFVVVSVAYGHSLNQQQLTEVASIFSFFILGVLPFALSSYFAQGHLAVKNTKVLMQTALISNVCGLLFNFILFRLMGLQGLALSTGLTYTIVAYWAYKQFLVVKTESIIR